MSVTVFCFAVCYGRIVLLSVRFFFTWAPSSHLWSSSFSVPSWVKPDLWLQLLHFSSLSTCLFNLLDFPFRYHTSLCPWGNLCLTFVCKGTLLCLFNLNPFQVSQPHNRTEVTVYLRSFLPLRRVDFPHCYQLRQ